ncbi:hypothetical protein C8R46DRAFT_517827 [Mycena filopes]|nr:hypothetical protein C8R46DRAFT_517827 [Mycena filopes]
MSDHTVATSVIPVQTEESRKDWLKDIFRRWYLAVKPGHGSPHVEHPPLKDWVNFLQRNPMTAEVAEDFAKTVYDEDKEMLKIEIEKRRLAMAASNHPDPRPEPQRQTAATQAPSSISAQGFPFFPRHIPDGQRRARTSLQLHFFPLDSLDPQQIFQHMEPPYMRVRYPLGHRHRFDLRLHTPHCPLDLQQICQQACMRSRLPPRGLSTIIPTPAHSKITRR